MRERWQRGEGPTYSDKVPPVKSSTIFSIDHPTVDLRWKFSQAFELKECNVRTPFVDLGWVTRSYLWYKLGDGYIELEIREKVEKIDRMLGTVNDSE